MLGFDYETLSAFAKSWGLFYLMGFFIVVVIYAFWPAKKKTFEQAARQILDDEDKPCR